MTPAESADISGGVTYEPVFHVVLYQPEIPQNTGNIGRTCLAVGAKLWLVRPLGFRLDQKSLRRAGLDYWQHLDWEAVDDWETLVDKLPAVRPWLFTKKAEQVYTNVSFRHGDVLVFGNEDTGLPATMRNEFHERLLRIPIRAPVRSLNLASAVAVALYEANRQCDDARGSRPREL